jgi:hypothetical protein
MKIFLLWAHCGYSDEYLVGVFSSKDEAVAAMAMHKKGKLGDRTEADFYEVHESGVDDPLTMRRVGEFKVEHQKTFYFIEVGDGENQARY